MFDLRNQVQSKFSALRIGLRLGLVAFAVGLSFQGSLVSFHQGRHAAESISHSPVSSQAAVHDLEITECTFCSVLHVATDSASFSPIAPTSFTPEILEQLPTSLIDSRLSLALPGARAPPVSSRLI